MSVLHTLAYILRHPLNRPRPWRGVMRFVRWQLASRLVRGEFAVPFVNNSRLLVRRGMRGATGNLYVGLMEFDDMGFLLHFLRRDDLFFDVGSNVGVYSVLASSGVGCRSVAVEPVPETYECLEDNLRLNRLEERVRAVRCGVGQAPGQRRFTADSDVTNRALAPQEAYAGPTVTVAIRTLDDLAGSETPIAVKIDVEGFEMRVLEGARRVLSDSRLQVVIVELNSSGRRYGHTDEATHRHLLQHGLQPVRYDPLQRSLISRTGFGANNTIYVRDPIRARERTVAAPPFRVLGRTV